MVGRDRRAWLPTGGVAGRTARLFLTYFRGHRRLETTVTTGPIRATPADADKSMFLCPDVTNYTNELHIYTTIMPFK